MKRIDTGGKATDLFGSGKHGWQNGNVGSGVPATQFSAEIMNNIQEELARIVEAAGIALDGAQYDQVLRALRQMFGGGYRLITANVQLTAADSGLVLIDASANQVTVTLPPATLQQRFHFIRIDTTGRSAKVVAYTAVGPPAVADMIDGAASVTLPSVGSSLGIIKAEAGQWRSLNRSAASMKAVPRGTYYAPDGCSFSSTAVLVAGSRIYLQRYSRLSGQTVYAVNTQVQTADASGKFILGLYTADANGLPYTRIDQSAEILANVAGVKQWAPTAAYPITDPIWVAFLGNGLGSFYVPGNIEGDSLYGAAAMNGGQSGAYPGLYVTGTAYAAGALPASLAAANFHNNAASAPPTIGLDIL